MFVHGWSCDRGYWNGQVDHVAARHQVVTVDLAGHGDSDPGRPEWTMPAFAEDVVAVVDDLGLTDVVLVGHSMGGDVIVEAALRLPGRVAGLVWVDVYRNLHETDPVDGAAADERFMAPFRADFAPTARAFVRGMFPAGADADLVDRVVEDMAAAPPDIALGAMKYAIGNENACLAALSQLTAPVVAINPTHPPTDVESMEDPGAFNRALDEVIASFVAARQGRAPATR